MVFSAPSNGRLVYSTVSVTHWAKGLAASSLAREECAAQEGREDKKHALRESTAYEVKHLKGKGSHR